MKQYLAYSGTNHYFLNCEFNELKSEIERVSGFKVKKPLFIDTKEGYIQCGFSCILKGHNPMNLFISQLVNPFVEVKNGKGQCGCNPEELVG